MNNIIVFPIECSLLWFFFVAFPLFLSLLFIIVSFHRAINALILLSFIFFPVLHFEFDWKSLQFFSDVYRTWRACVCVFVRNNRQMIAYQFNVFEKIYLFYFIFSSFACFLPCNSRWNEFICCFHDFDVHAHVEIRFLIQFALNHRTLSLSIFQ